MKNKMQTALGLGVGVLLYELFKHGALQIDWVRPVFVGGFSFIIFLLLPRRWFEKKPKS